MEMEDLRKAFVTFDENDALLMKSIDEIFRNKVVKQGAKEYFIPSMLEEEVLEKSGYFRSFPQHLTIPAFVKRECFDQTVKNKKVTETQVGMQNIYLTPSACLGLYPMLEGKTINDEIFTMNVNVYRYEEGRFDGKVRFWDYNVREVVFVGGNEFVNSKMGEFMDITKEISNEIGIPMSIMSATDMFYPTPENRIKKRFQSANDLKFEMISHVDGKQVALGSFNYHNNHFSVPFHFDQNGTTISACIGYGLQRWVAAIKDAGEQAINKVINYGKISEDFVMGE